MSDVEQKNTATLPVVAPTALPTGASQLPVKDDEDFIGEFEVMNLDELQDKTFIVTVGTGEPEDGQFLCSTIHGPYEYIEMIEEVGFMWKTHQHHAFVLMLDPNRDNRNKFLDKNTIDYIEANWESIITDSILSGAIEKDYTCKAGILEAAPEADPRHLPDPYLEPTEEEDEDVI